MSLWVQAYAPDSRILVEFKNAMLMGLYNAELNKTCPFFMPKELQHENKIKAVLDHWLVHLRKYNMDPRAPSHDMAGLRSTHSFEKVGNSTRYDEILKTGQIPMEENVIPDEGGEVSGDVNKLQARDTYFFCKKKVISHLIAEVRGETQGGKMNSKMEPENWQKWQNR